MIFLDGAWSIITLPVGKSWDTGGASTMPFGSKGVNQKVPFSPHHFLSSIKAAVLRVGQPF